MKTNVIHVILLIFIGYSCLVLKTLIPSYILFFLYYKTILKFRVFVFSMFVCSLLIAIIDPKNALQFFCLTVSISIIGKEFIYENVHFEKYFSIAQLLFVAVFILFGEPSFNYSWLEIFTGTGRLGFTLGTYQLNPNILGMLSAIAFLYQIRQKKYVSSLPHIFIVLLTQSRGAIVFIACTLIISKIRRIKEISSFVILLSILFIGLYFSPLWESLSNRFLNEGGSARLEIWSHYLSKIWECFPFGATREQFFYILDNYGPLDNLYLMALIRFGIIGGLYCFYLIIKSGLNYLQCEDKFYPSFCISFMIYGLVESGPIHNLMYAIAFSMALNHGKARSMIKG